MFTDISFEQEETENTQMRKTISQKFISPRLLSSMSSKIKNENLLPKKILLTTRASKPILTYLSPIQPPLDEVSESEEDFKVDIHTDSDFDSIAEYKISGNTNHEKR